MKTKKSQKHVGIGKERTQNNKRGRGKREKKKTFQSSATLDVDIPHNQKSDVTNPKKKKRRRGGPGQSNQTLMPRAV